MIDYRYFEHDLSFCMLTITFLNQTNDQIRIRKLIATNKR
jgi:hypothetical protein